MNDLSLTPLLARYAAGHEPDVMARLVEGYLPLSRRIARRFAGHGVETEDLEQVAAMALMKAIERFEPERGLQFSTFAAPTIAGEVRNYIRDKGAMIRMSRDARAQLSKMRAVQDRLSQELGREPSMKEVAEAMNATYDELLEWLEQREASGVVSMSAPVSEEEELELESRLGMLEQGYEQAEQRAWMEWVMRQVTPAEQKLLRLRFIHRLGQRDTAKAMGVSQMQVSRMERRVLARLRDMTERWQEARM